MKLRSFALGVTLLLGFTGLFAAFLLVKTADYLDEIAKEIGGTVQSVQTAEELELGLMQHNRQRLLFSLTHNEKHATKSQEVVRAMERQIEKARLYASTGREKEVVEEVVSLIDRYYSVRQQLEAKRNPPLEQYLIISAHVDEARVALDELININVQQADVLEKRAVFLNWLSTRMGVSVAILLLLAMGGAIFAFWKLIYDPLIALRRAISSFRPDNLAARATSSGVLELKQISGTFNDMALSINRNRETQLRFIAAVAHDLKNPLGAIKMSAEIIRSDSSLPTNKRDEMLQTIHNEADHLDHMLEDLLDTARIEAGTCDLKSSRVDLRQPVREAAGLFSTVSRLHQFTISIPEEPVYCECDSSRIRQVVNNLLSNAIKYSPYGGRVSVGVASENSTAVISVADHGMGVAPEDKEKIFEPFHRSYRTGETIPGVGLGLSVSKKIIEAHGGRIEVKSEMDRGSTFRVILPARRASLSA